MRVSEVVADQPGRIELHEEALEEECWTCHGRNVLRRRDLDIGPVRRSLADNHSENVYPERDREGRAHFRIL